MTDQTAHGPVKRVQMEATVIRADGSREVLGVVADSKWRWCDPRQYSAARRIRRANRKAGL